MYIITSLLVSLSVSILINYFLYKKRLDNFPEVKKMIESNKKVETKNIRILTKDADGNIKII